MEEPSKGLYCPNCNNVGWYEIIGTDMECCQCPTETGECCGSPNYVPVPEQEQCQFCYEVPMSKFNVARRAKI